MTGEPLARRTPGATEPAQGRVTYPVFTPNEMVFLDGVVPPRTWPNDAATLRRVIDALRNQPKGDT